MFVLQPTKLVTSYDKPAPERPKIQPSIREAFSSTALRPQPTTNGHTHPGSAAPPGGTSTGAGGIPVASGNGAGGGDGGGGGTGDNGGAKPSAPARRQEGPPPAKRPRPTEPGEPVYEPVASQVVRRAGTAFHYYCRDMRRKCEWRKQYSASFSSYIILILIRRNGLLFLYILHVEIYEISNIIPTCT